ncbi:hypothetical protein L873DRAFT_1735260 [Choiromyces venosus 120613-1]|uniref:Rhodopsin domain-containing protein n=1 Tax=Choiromyces venosus 120613-1 TaxID=1336337 RepID=A0A3N4K5D5_9PEZI|nr:hypothetical protein L873DRAFT_1735260 [Choiromyces venosus 120613-1]
MARDPPPSVIDGWPAANTVNPPHRGATLVVVESTLVVLVFVVVCLRVYSRVWIRKAFGLDDWIILPAALASIGLAATTLLATIRYGWGAHIWDLSLETVETSLLLSWVSELIFTWSISLTKLSLCAFYLRLLGPANPFERKIIYIVIGIVFLWWGGFTAAIIAQCNPVQAVWLINYPGGGCVDRKVGIALHAGVDLLTGGAIYVLPIPTVLSLGMEKRKKWLLVGIFALGGLVCIAAIVRLPLTLRLTSYYDTTWYICDSYIWTTLESHLAIICASTPSLAPLINLASSPSPPHHTASITGFSKPCIHQRSKDTPFSGASLTFALANISTTATSTAPPIPQAHLLEASAGRDWYGYWPQVGNVGHMGIGMGRGFYSGDSESTELIALKDGDGSKGMGEEMGITKTTVIEQSFDEIDLEECRREIKGFKC